MVVPYGDRSGVVIEPWLTDQWFCDAKKMSIEPIHSVKNGQTKFIPKSVIFTSPVSEIRILPGLRSRWITPAW